MLYPLPSILQIFSQISALRHMRVECVQGGFIGNTYWLYPLPSIHKDDPVDLSAWLGRQGSAIGILCGPIVPSPCRSGFDFSAEISKCSDCAHPLRVLWSWGHCSGMAEGGELVCIKNTARRHKPRPLEKPFVSEGFSKGRGDGAGTVYRVCVLGWSSLVLRALPKVVEGRCCSSCMGMT